MSEHSTKTSAVGRHKVTASDARTAYAMERFPEQIAAARSHLRVLKVAAGENEDAAYFASEAAAALDAADAAFKAMSEATKAK